MSPCGSVKHLKDLTLQQFSSFESVSARFTGPSTLGSLLNPSSLSPADDNATPSARAMHRIASITMLLASLEKIQPSAIEELFFKTHLGSVSVASLIPIFLARNLENDLVQGKPSGPPSATLATSVGRSSTSENSCSGDQELNVDDCGSESANVGSEAANDEQPVEHHQVEPCDVNKSTFVKVEPHGHLLTEEENEK